MPAGSRYVNFRCSEELFVALTGAAKEQGVSQSQMARFLLENALGSTPENAAKRAILGGVQHALRARVGLLTHEISQLVAKHLQEGLVGDLAYGVVAGTTRPQRPARSSGPAWPALAQAENDET